MYKKCSTCFHIQRYWYHFLQHILRGCVFSPLNMMHYMDKKGAKAEDYGFSNPKEKCVECVI